MGGLPWYWEGNVQARVAAFLKAQGWTITRSADTASFQKGIDLIAAMGDRRLAVEVKGFPGTVYARGPKAGQAKPTKPALQARHWFGEAILSGILIRGSDEHIEIALAFPDVPRYRQLLARSVRALACLSFRVLLTNEAGIVTEFEVSQEPARSLR
jgi:hypothetical protein